MKNRETTIILAWIILILLNTFIGRQVYDFINVIGGRALSIGLISLFALICGVCVAKQIRKDKIIAFCGLILFGMIGALILDLPEERLHVVKFGFLGFLVIAPPISTNPYWILFCVFVAVMDEGIQALLPYRVGDIRDIVINIISLAWGCSVSLICSKSYPGGKSIFKPWASNSIAYKIELK